MNTRKPLEERLGDLGHTLGESAPLRGPVLDRIARLDDPRATWLDALRQWAVNYSSVLTVWVVGLLTLACAYLVKPPSVAAPPQAYFYDTVLGILYTDDAATLSPAVSPAGNPAVRAHVFSCGSCAESERFVGYFERYTEPLFRALEHDPVSAAVHERWAEGREYSTDGRAWFVAESPQGAAASAPPYPRCPEKRLRYCPPP